MHLKAEELQRSYGRRLLTAWAKTPDRAETANPRATSTGGTAMQPTIIGDTAELPDVDVHQRDGQATIAAADGSTERAIQVSHRRHAVPDHDPVHRNRASTGKPTRAAIQVGTSRCLTHSARLELRRAVRCGAACRCAAWSAVRYGDTGRAATRMDQAHTSGDSGDSEPMPDTQRAALPAGGTGRAATRPRKTVGKIGSVIPAVGAVAAGSAAEPTDAAVAWETPTACRR
ncbi:hypothetical protein GCM10010116_49000 [Microbispora rosea subsp. aerata]|nr:hypothetical protein GCM10010116_49000 [Microbispora rosea subsp. aerata]GLJ82217.1 hypothetical protein GCM10017588_09420 [Microbispora rosea subsp. aerata]